jgi:hypothetical protein
MVDWAQIILGERLDDEAAKLEGPILLQSECR